MEREPEASEKAPRPLVRIRGGLHWGLWLVVTGLAATARADTLDEIRHRGRLVWGADQEGGGPYVYADPNDPQRLMGFEAELAEVLAGHLVRPQFFQANWDNLPAFLRNGEIDIVLNGYEWTPERAAQMEATRPYYIYELQLLARADDPRIRSWEDLRRREGRRLCEVSALAGSAAAAYLREHWANDVRIVEYDGNANAMAKVRDGTHEATLQDLPIALFYGKDMRFVGDPVGRGYYVIYARKGASRLVQQLNHAIEESLRDGRLKAIYEKYGLWNRTQEELIKAAPVSGRSASTSGWGAVQQYGPLLVQAAGITVLLSGTAMPIAMVVGLFVALGRLYGPSPLRWALTVYVEVLRGTPVMLQLWVIYFLLPQLLPVSPGPLYAAIFGLAINYSAYEAEIYRAGLQAIPAGQMQAALALGMSRATALRRILVPQAVRIVVPPVTNDFIALFKDTSICSVIAVVELTKRYSILANNNQGAILVLAAMTALLYLAMSYPLSLLAGRMERRLAGRR
ncbi:MAG: ABC transporter permease subunit [Planctomycetes bacterium]|nr:ABC transporter permease subunit [Planctomycetota bacterium]